MSLKKYNKNKQNKHLRKLENINKNINNIFNNNIDIIDNVIKLKNNIHLNYDYYISHYQ